MALGNPILLPGQALRTLTITGTPVLTATAGVPYEGFALVGSGGVAPLTFGASVPPPASIAADPVTGDVAGTPLVAGVSVGITFTVTDATGAVAGLDPFDLTIAEPVSISGTPTTTGTAGAAIDPFTVTTDGGTAPITLSLVGSWPPGASVDSDTGIVTPGTAPSAHTYTGLSIEAEDAYGSVADLAPFQIEVTAAAEYTCGGVVFDGATDLHLDALTATDGGFVSFSVWALSASWSANFGCPLWANDPDTLGGGFYPGNGHASGANRWFVVDPTSVLKAGQASDTPDGVWVNWVGTAQTNLGAGSKIIKLFRNRVDVTASVVDADASFDVLFSGRPFWIGNDNAGDFFTGDMADLWAAPNQSLLTGSTIASGTLDKFITAGLKPVDLGDDGSTPTGTAPAIFLHIDAAGDPADFGDNLGTGGAFSVNAGVTQTGALVNTSADVVMSDVTGITVGAFITVTGVPAGTTVLSIDTLTVTMSAAATATNPTASIKFGGVLRLAPSSPSD